MIETDFPAAARALRANLGIGEEEKLTIPNIAISVEKLRQEIKQEREARERAERERDELRNALQLISSGTTADILGLTSMSKQDMQSIARRALEGSNAT